MWKFDIWLGVFLKNGHPYLMDIAKKWYSSNTSFNTTKWILTLRENPKVLWVKARKETLKRENNVKNCSFAKFNFEKSSWKHHNLKNYFVFGSLLLMVPFLLLPFETLGKGLGNQTCSKLGFLWTVGNVLKSRYLKWDCIPHLKI